MEIIKPRTSHVPGRTGITLAFNARAPAPLLQKGLLGGRFPEIFFIVLRHQGPRRLLQPWGRGPATYYSGWPQTWCCRHDAGFTSMQDARVVVPGRLPSGFQSSAEALRGAARETVGMIPETWIVDGGKLQPEGGASSREAVWAVTGKLAEV